MRRLQYWRHMIHPVIEQFIKNQEMIRVFFKKKKPQQTLLEGNKIYLNLNLLYLINRSTLIKNLFFLFLVMKIHCFKV